MEQPWLKSPLRLEHSTNLQSCAYAYIGVVEGIDFMSDWLGDKGKFEVFFFIGWEKEDHDYLHDGWDVERICI